MVKGVIFDMDGLMFDTERLWDTLWEPACAALGLPLPADMEKFRAGGRGLAGDNLRRHVAEYIPGDPQKVLDKIWQLGDERFARGVPCKKGLKELLAALEDMGLPRIVASSSPRNMIEMNLQTPARRGISTMLSPVRRSPTASPHPTPFWSRRKSCTLTRMTAWCWRTALTACARAAPRAV